MGALGPVGDGLLNSLLDAGHMPSASACTKLARRQLGSCPNLQKPIQGLMTKLGVGNEKSTVGEDDWLFFNPGIKSLVGPAFLDEKQLHKRTRTSTDNRIHESAFLISVITR